AAKRDGPKLALTKEPKQNGRPTTPAPMPGGAWRKRPLGGLGLGQGTMEQLEKAGLKNVGDVVSKIGVPANDRASFAHVAETEFQIGNRSAIELGNAVQLVLDEAEEGAAAKVR